MTEDKNKNNKVQEKISLLQPKIKSPIKKQEKNRTKNLKGDSSSIQHWVKESERFQRSVISFMETRRAQLTERSTADRKHEPRSWEGLTTKLTMRESKGKQNIQEILKQY